MAIEENRPVLIEAMTYRSRFLIYFHGLLLCHDPGPLFLSDITECNSDRARGIQHTKGKSMSFGLRGNDAASSCLPCAARILFLSPLQYATPLESKGWGLQLLKLTVFVPGLLVLVNGKMACRSFPGSETNATVCFAFWYTVMSAQLI